MLKWVSPFRYLRIVGYLLLPVAFRSLSRLSSALSAKASSLRSYSLNLFHKYSVIYGQVWFVVVACFLDVFSISRFLNLLYAVFKVRVCFWYTVTKNTNGDEEIRTHDPLLARQVLSQLSYTPIKFLNLLFVVLKDSFSTGLKWTRTTDLTLIRRAL